MMIYNALTILFYIIVNILILGMSYITYVTNKLDGNDNGLSAVSLVYLIALGIAFWFYFKTNQGRNILIGTSFLIYLLIYSVYPEFE